VRPGPQDLEEPREVPLLRHVGLAWDPDEAPQRGVAPEVPQAGVEGGVPQEDRQQDDAPEGLDRVVVAAVAARAAKGVQQSSVRHDGQEVANGQKAGAVKVTILLTPPRPHL
jgi:hypothetical protein